MEGSTLILPAIPGYRLIRPLGPPGVYEAEDLTTRDAVALQVIAGDVVTAPGFALRFELEAGALGQVRHPNVAEVRYARAPTAGAAGPAFLRLEPLIGETLEERLEHAGALRPSTAVRIALQVLDGLAAAQRGGALHRDLRPATVFLVPGPDGKPRVKLVGFGLDRPIVRDAGPDEPPDELGVAVVDPGYAAPELFCGGVRSEASSVFECGMLLYRMLVGRLPFRETDARRLRARRLADCRTPDPYPSVRTFVPELAEPLAAAVAQALRKDVAERSTLIEFRRGLLAVESGSTGARSGSASPRPAGPSGRSSAPPEPVPRVRTVPPAAATKPMPSATPPPTVAPEPAAEPTHREPGRAARGSDRAAPVAAPRPPSSRTGLVLLATGTALALLAAAILFWSRPPSPDARRPAGEGVAARAPAGEEALAVPVPPSPVAGPATTVPAAPPFGAGAPGAVPSAVDAGAPEPDAFVPPENVDVGATTDAPAPIVEIEVPPPVGAPLPPPAPGMVRLTFDVVPRDATVRVDGRQVGILHSIDVPQSPHAVTLSVEPPAAWRSQYQAHVGYYVPLSSRTIRLRLERAGTGDGGAR